MSNGREPLKLVGAEGDKKRPSLNLVGVDEPLKKKDSQEPSQESSIFSEGERPLKPIDYTLGLHQRQDEQPSSTDVPEPVIAPVGPDPNAIFNQEQVQDAERHLKYRSGYGAKASEQRAFFATDDEVQEITNELVAKGIDPMNAQLAISNQSKRFVQRLGEDYQAAQVKEKGHEAVGQEMIVESIAFLPEDDRDTAKRNWQRITLNNQLKELPKDPENAEARSKILTQLSDLKAADNRPKEQMLYDPDTGQYVNRKDAMKKPELITFDAQVDAIFETVKDMPLDKLKEVWVNSYFQYKAIDDIYTDETTTIIRQVSGQEVSIAPKDIATGFRRFGHEAEFDIDDETAARASGLRERHMDELAQFQAVNRALLMNEDPASVEKSLLKIAGAATARELGLDESLTDTDVKFVREFVSAMEEGGGRLTEAQKKNAEVTMGENILDAVGGSIPAMAEIGATMFLMQGFGAAGTLSRTGKYVKELFSKNWGKAGEYTYNLLKQGGKGAVSFGLGPSESTTYAMGFGEGITQGVLDKLNPEKLFGKKYSKLLELGFRVAGGTITETAQEFAGDYLDNLDRNGIDYGTAFKETFGRDIEDFYDKLTVIAATSAMFSTAFNSKVIFRSKEVINSMPDSDPRKAELTEVMETLETNIENQKEVDKKPTKPAKVVEETPKPEGKEVKEEETTPVTEGTKPEDKKVPKTEGVEEKPTKTKTDGLRQEEEENASEQAQDGRVLERANIPVSDITTDTKSFQPRFKLNEEKVQKLVEKWDWAKYDDIIVWKNPKGQAVVLKGHHRLEAAERRNMDDLPVKVFTGTKQEAIDFARTSNEADNLQSDSENAASVITLREEGKTEKELREFTKENFGAQGGKIYHISKLDPKGKAVTTLKQFEKAGDVQTQNKIKRIADWIGKSAIKNDYSRAQENELFDFLMDEVKSKKIKNRDAFTRTVDAVIEPLKEKGKWNKGTVINISKAAETKPLEAEYNARLKEAQKAVDTAKKEYAEKSQEFRARVTDSKEFTNEDLETALKPYEATLRKALNTEADVRKTKSEIDQADEAQVALFSKGDKGPKATPEKRGSSELYDMDKRKVQKEEKPRQKIFEESIRILRKYAPMSAILQGKEARGTLGTFWPKTKHVATHSLNDIGTTFHELAHALDDQFGIIKKAPNDGILYDQLNEIYEMYYGGAKETASKHLRKTEGYAVLMEKYLGYQHTFNMKYPEAVQAFLTEGGPYAFPGVENFVQEISDVVANYQAATALEQVGQIVYDDPIDLRFKTAQEKREHISTRIAEETSDVYAYIEALDKKNNTFFTFNDVAQQFRFAERWVTFASNNISGRPPGLVNKARKALGAKAIMPIDGYYVLDENANWVKKYDFNWNTLTKGLTKDFGRNGHKEFGWYLVARRVTFDYKKLEELAEEAIRTQDNIASIEKDIKSLDDKAPKEEAISLEASLRSAKSILQSVEAEHKRIEDILVNDRHDRHAMEATYNEFNKKYKKYEKQYDKMMDEHIARLAHPKVGLLAVEEANKYLATPGYAPFKRLIFDEITGEGGDASTHVTIPSGKASKPSFLLQRKGSEKPILNPLLSSIAAEADVTRRAMMQMAYNSMGDMAANATGDNTLAFHFKRETNTSLAMEDGTRVFPRVKDPKYLVTTKNGKKSVWLISEDIRRVVEETATFDDSHIGWKIAQASSRLFKTGTTGAWLPFLVNNIPIDQLTSFVQTKTNFIPVYSSAKEMTLAFARKGAEREYLQEYLWLADTSHTSGGWNKASFRHLDIKLLDKSIKQKTLRVIERLSDIITAPSNYSEIMTRATEYIKARKLGHDQKIALEMAGRVSAPFHHRGRVGGGTGKVGQEMMRTLPYANASVEVLAQSLRTLNTKEGRQRFSIALGALIATMTGATMYALRARGDEEDWQRWKDLYSSLHPTDLSRYVYMPSPFKDHTLVKIRVPDNYATFASLINMAYIQHAADTKYTPHEWYEAASAPVPDIMKPWEGGKWLLTITPQLLRGGTEVVFNKKTFPDIRPIENFADAKKLPWLRKNQWSSPVAVEVARTDIAKKMDMSPKKIDHLILSYGGRTAQFLTAKPNRLSLEQVYHREMYVEGSRQVQWYFGESEFNEQALNHIKTWVKKDIEAPPGFKMTDEEAVYSYEGPEFTTDEAEFFLERKYIMDQVNERIKEYRDTDVDNAPKEAGRIQIEMFELIRELQALTNKGPKP